MLPATTTATSSAQAASTAPQTAIIDINPQYLPEPSVHGMDLVFDDDNVSCCTNGTENLYKGVEHCWNKTTWLFNQGIKKIDAKIERGYGRKASSEDVASIMLFILSVIEAIFSARVWVSPRAEFGISAIITMLILMVDRKNYNEKFKELADLQLELLKTFCAMPELIEQVEVNRRSTGKCKTINNCNCAEHLINYWHLCSELNIKLRDGQEIRLYNLSNISSGYAQFSNGAIAASWLIAFVNIAFDLMETIIPKASLAHGSMADAQTNFAANFTLDLRNETFTIPISGNYTGTCDDGMFDGKAHIEHSITSNPLYHTMDRVATVLGGVPYRSIANWITTYLLQQQISIRNFSKYLAETLEQKFADARINKTPAMDIPKELLAVLDKTNQEDLQNRIASLSGKIEEYNKALALEQGRQQGMRFVASSSDQIISELRTRLAKPEPHVDLANFNDPLANAMRAAAEQAYANSSSSRPNLP